MKSAILLVPVLLTGCATKSNRAVFKEFASVSGNSQSHIIVPGDKLAIAVPLDPRAETVTNMEITVDRDGCIDLPQAGRIRVAGETSETASELITEAFLDHGFREGAPPHRSYYFQVTGEVNKPGRILYIRETSLRLAVESAGGLTRRANRGNISIRRLDGKVEHYNFDRLVKHPQDDPRVYPKDEVIVPAKKFFW